MQVQPPRRLPSVLDFSAAESLLESLRHLPPATALDASGVEVLTLACMQVILAALKAEPSLSIENPSEAFVSAFNDLALDWRRETVAAPEAVQTDEADMTKRILTIDDSKTIRDMLNLTLSEAGYEVLQAVDGEDGIGMLGKERVDLVITDINMPKMDGYAVVRHMRSKEEFKNTPVLVLTTESDAEKRNVAREAGATGWMVKPFDPERLVATVNKVAAGQR
jgi:two-component system chemotaxis response regulator CheY